MSERIEDPGPMDGIPENRDPEPVSGPLDEPAEGLARQEWARLARRLKRDSREPSKPGPKELSAYRFGFLIRLAEYNFLSLERGWEPSTVLALGAAIDGARRSLGNLKDDVGPRARVESIGLLNEIRNFTQTPDQPWNWAEEIRLGPSRQGPGWLWEQLRETGGRALEGTQRLCSWYEVGAALGDYQLRLLASDAEDLAESSENIDMLALEEASGPDPGSLTVGLPDFGPVVRAVLALPEHERSKAPLLVSMARLVPSLEESGTAAYLEEFLRLNAKSWGDRLGDVDLLTVSIMVPRLDAHIQTKLRSRTPSWHGGQLWLDGVILRTVKGQGNVITVILDAFEKMGWPATIQDPLGQVRNTGRLHNTVDSLNTGLRFKLFYVERGGRAVGWSLPPEL